ncbi:MAG TPA: hypothetical protein VER96_04795 [Polyangiaceae bacterium]|nr:hypothetical protein [Polyangiaceae bacterium]
MPASPGRGRYWRHQRHAWQPLPSALKGVDIGSRVRISGITFSLDVGRVGVGYVGNFSDVTIENNRFHVTGSTGNYWGISSVVFGPGPASVFDHLTIRSNTFTQATSADLVPIYLPGTAARSR